MRVVLFTETFLPKIDGIVTRLTHTVDHLVRAGDDVLVVAPAPAPAEHAGARVLAVPSMPFALYPELKLAISGRKIGKQLLEFAPDLVHVVNPAVLGACGVAHAVKRRIPLVASYHTHVPKYLSHYRLSALEGFCWAMIRGLHNRARLNLCTSSQMIDELQANGVHRLRLWPRAVDTELFRPDRKSAEMRSELSGGRPDAPLLLYVGRLAPEKEIERIRPVLEAIPEAILALVGDGPSRARVEQHFAGSRARFAGYLKGERLAAAFASADALVFPSRTETLGLVLLEAMASGCPVVAARAGGIPDVVTDGVNGCLFDPADDQGLVAAVHRLMDDRALATSLHLEARAEAERWSWSSATQALRGFYEEALAACPAGAVSPRVDPRARPAPRAGQ